MMRLSCHRFRFNEVRLWLSVIAYNLDNLWRRQVLPRKIATALHELPDVLGIKNPEKSGIGRMSPNWNAKMEIPV